VSTAIVAPAVRLFHRRGRSVELPHAKKVGPGKTAQPRLSSGDVSGQFVNHAIAPFRSLEFSTDGFSHLPVKFDQGCIHRLQRPNARGLDQPNNIAKSIIGLSAGQICR
jgi:hypothetical protein